MVTFLQSLQWIPLGYKYCRSHSKQAASSENIFSKCLKVKHSIFGFVCLSIPTIRIQYGGLCTYCQGIITDPLAFRLLFAYTKRRIKGEHNCRHAPPPNALLWSFRLVLSTLEWNRLSEVEAPRLSPAGRYFAILRRSGNQHDFLPAHPADDSPP